VAANNVFPLTVRLKGETSSYTSAMKGAQKTNTHFTNSVQGVGKGLTAVEGPLNGVTGRFTALSGLMTGTAGKMALVGAAFAASSLAVASSVRELAGYEEQQLKTSQMLEATSYAAGLSSQQLAQNADAVALATLASVEGIQEAQGVLLSFKTVQEETFTEAIMLSQDMAAVFGGTAKDKAMQLGKALEDPVQGLNALKRSGVSFTESQKDMIKSLDETGNRAEAQRLILKQLEDQIGGSARAQAGGLSGSVDTLSQRWDELQRKWAESSGAAKTIKGWIDSLAISLKSLGDDVAPSVDALETKLASLEKRLSTTTSARGRKAAVAASIAEVTDELLRAKAASGDIEAVNTLIANTTGNIEKMEAAKAAKPTTKRRGQMARKGSSGDTELAQQKTDLKDLIALQTQLNSVKEKGAKTQEDLKGDSAPTVYDQLGYSEDQIASGLDRVEATLNSIAERELAAVMSRQDMIDMAMESGQINDEKWNLLTQQNQEQHEAKLTEISKKAAKERATNEAAAQKAGLDAFRGTSGMFLEALEKSGGEKTAIYKAAFAAQKAAAIPGMIASTEEGATAALALGPVAGPIAAGTIRAMGYASIGLVAGQTIAGVAHGGMGYIPEESTYLLQRGEGVLSPKQNVAVQQAADRINNGQGGGSGVVVNIIEDASRAGQVEESKGPSGEDMINAFVASVNQGGAAAEVVEQRYGLERVGR
jgi:hypothetical protein